MPYKIIQKKGKETADIRYYGAKGGYAYATKKEAELIKKLMVKKTGIKLIVKKV